MPRQVTRLLTIAFFASLAACSTVTTTGVKNTSKTFNTVVVDAGHGGKDSGAYRRYGPPEKMIALDVAQRLNRKLRESQLKTVMTRNSDVFIELNDRVAIENAQKNAIFVSIHFNDSRRRGVRGFETYYHSGASSDLANRIQRKLMTIPHSAEWRRAHGKFSRAPPGELSRGTGGMRILEQSLRGKQDARFGIS